MVEDKRTADEQPAMQTVGYLPSGVIFSTVILGLLGFAAIKLMDPATLPVRHVSVAGDFRHLSPSRLEQRVTAVVRGGFFNVDVEAIQLALLEEPWIRLVSVKRIWPDRITVVITEQTAVAQWGDAALLNPDAQIFRPDRSTFPQGLAVISGPENTAPLVLSNFLKIQAMLPQGLSLNQLSLSERRSWQLKISNGPEVRLGKSGIISRMERFLRHFPAEELNKLQQVEYIDMRYTNGFAIRWNPQTKSDPESEQHSHGEKI
jgi:cell division protein FtsQ